MATPQRRSTGDLGGVTVPFSYAQAAKGMSSSSNSGGNSSKSGSGTITPAKETPQASVPLPGAPVGTNLVGDADTQPAPASKEPEKFPTERESLPNGVTTPVGKSTVSQQLTAASAISSPDLGAASASTPGRDDDISSLQNVSSESTWESKSQGSNAAEKSKEKSDVVQEKAQAKEAEKEKVTPKTLQDAPLPTVNVWKLRAEELAAKARAAAPVSPPKVGPPAEPANGVTTQKPVDAIGADSTRKSKPDDNNASSANSKDKRQNADGHARRSKDDDHTSLPRRETRTEGEPRRKSSGRGKEDKSVPSAPLPPARDQESWPTPESAQDEDKRRILEKGDKGEKDRSAAPSSRPHGKNEWVPVPYTPSVVFNTPMPNSASRRGGRGAGRGGAQSGGRGGSYNSSGSGDKDSSTLTNGDGPKRAKPEGSTRREQSPSKSRSAPWKESKSSHATERSNKHAPEGANDTQEVKRASSEEGVNGQTPSQGANASRALPNNRQRLNRKLETSGSHDRRRDGDLVSPTRENAPHSYGRRMSSATQTEDSEVAERKAGFTADGQASHPKSAPPERRSGPFASYPGREREPRTRGGMRGGRGGGHGSFANSSHTNGQPYVNGNASLQSSTFPLPKSPSSYYPDQSGAFFTSPPRSYGRSGTRPQSISTEAIYNRVQSGFSAASQNVPPLQTFMNGPYDYQMMQPMSAVPWTPFLGQDQLFSIVTTQIEYYFSIENLCKDMFLRKHMDSKGFVFLSVIADFNRIKQLTTDMELIKFACYHSREIEYRIGADGRDRLRRCDGWEQWVLPTGDRDPSVQNDGPDEVHHPPIPHPQGIAQGFDPFMMRYAMGPMSGPTSPGLHQDPSFPTMNSAGINGTGNAPAGNAGIVDGSAFADVMSPQGTGAPTYQGPHMISGNMEADSFSDEQVEALTIIVRKQDPAHTSIPSNPLASRTFSNGTIDSQSISDELPSLEARQNGPNVNGHVPAQGEEMIMSPDVRGPLSPGDADKNSISNPVRLFWVKDKDTPVEQLPDESTCELYTHLRSKALGQRQAALPGICPYDMDVLYQFWSHFLIRNFNTRMYNEFRLLAFEDVNQRLCDTGIKNLIKYYGEALASQSTIRQRIARHYVELVKSENPDGARPAFKQLRSAWRNGALNLKNRKKIADFVDHELKAKLES